MKPKTKQLPTPKAPARAMYVGVDTDAGVLCFNKGHLAKKNVRGVVAVIPRATAKQAKAIVRQHSPGGFFALSEDEQVGVIMEHLLENDTYQGAARAVLRRING